MNRLLATLVFPAMLLASGAIAACPESMNRDPTFIALAIDEGAPRPKSVEDFNFVNDTTTFADLTAKVGQPDAAKGTNSFVYCLADGNIITNNALPEMDMMIYWKANQNLRGLSEVGPGEGGAVSFWAHAVGFIFGAVLIKMFATNARVKEHASNQYRPRSVGWD